MDTTDPIITFNDQGVCNHCTEYLNVRADYSYKGNETDKQFQSLVEKIKSDGKNRSYDCVVGLSGGVDSSYVAYLAKKKWATSFRSSHG
jgi:NH3-dependent NAD+ synthetase